MDRKQEMTVLHFEQGWTMQQIADIFGISRERVRQIIGNSNDARRKLTEKILLQDMENKTTSEIKDSVFDKIRRPIVKVLDEKIALQHHLPDRTGRSTGLINGINAENNVANILQVNGFNVELMPFGHPFDLLVNGKKVDVKYSSSLSMPPRGKTPFYRFAIRKNIKPNSCDFFIFSVFDSNKLWIIPNSKLPNVNMVYITKNLSHHSWKQSKRWDEYINRFELLTG